MTEHVMTKCYPDNHCLADLINANNLSAGFSHLTASVYKSGNDAIAATHQSQTSLQGAVNQSVEATRDEGGKTRQDICGIARDALQEFGNTRREICEVKHDLSVELCNVRKEVSDVKHEVAISTKEILLETHKAESRTREELLKGFHQTQLDACKNTQTLSAQLAECCCKLEAEIKDQNSRTRELILAQEAKAKDTEIANLKLQLAVCNRTPV